VREHRWLQAGHLVTLLDFFADFEAHFLVELLSLRFLPLCIFYAVSPPLGKPIPLDMRAPVLVWRLPVIPPTALDGVFSRSPPPH